MTKAEAIALVEENAGKTFDWEVYSCDPQWDIEWLVDYIYGLEKCDDGDYPLVLSDIEQRIESCGFGKDMFWEIVEAIGLKEDFAAILA